MDWIAVLPQLHLAPEPLDLIRSLLGQQMQRPTPRAIGRSSQSQLFHNVHDVLRSTPPAGVRMTQRKSPANRRGQGSLDEKL